MTIVTQAKAAPNRRSALPPGSGADRVETQIPCPSCCGFLTHIRDHEGTNQLSLHETRGGSVGAALVLTLTEPWREVAGW